MENADRSTAQCAGLGSAPRPSSSWPRDPSGPPPCSGSRAGHASSYARPRSWSGRPTVLVIEQLARPHCLQRRLPSPTAPLTLVTIANWARTGPAHTSAPRRRANSATSSGARVDLSASSPVVHRRAATPSCTACLAAHRPALRAPPAVLPPTRTAASRRLPRGFRDSAHTVLVGDVLSAAATPHLLYHELCCRRRGDPSPLEINRGLPRGHHRPSDCDRGLSSPDGPRHPDAGAPALVPLLAADHQSRRGLREPRGPSRRGFERSELPPWAQPRRARFGDHGGSRHPHAIVHADVDTFYAFRSGAPASIARPSNSRLRPGCCLQRLALRPAHAAAACPDRSGATFPVEILDATSTYDDTTMVGYASTLRSATCRFRSSARATESVLAGVT